MEHDSRADPPYTQNRAPETPGGTLALKDVLILVSFLILASSMGSYSRQKYCSHG